MNQKSMNPYTDIDAAIRAIKAFDRSPEDFCLPISDEIQDPLGMSMAIITDVKKWTPLSGQCGSDRAARLNCYDKLSIPRRETIRNCKEMNLCGGWQSAS